MQNGQVLKWYSANPAHSLLIFCCASLVRSIPFGIASFAHSSMNGFNAKRSVLKNILIIVLNILILEIVVEITKLKDGILRKQKTVRKSI